MSFERLTMPIGQAMSTQRSVRKFRPDPIPAEDLRLILEAAVKAPNGGNHQIGRFLAVTDRDKIQRFAKLYQEAWWAKRRETQGWTKPEDIPPDEKNYRAAMTFADTIGTVPAIVFALAVPPGWANSIIPACQNLMLAAHALGIGSIPTTLHPTVMDRFHTMFGIPKDVSFHFCIPLGYPAVPYGPSRRKPIAETAFLDRWGEPGPWR
jgi:nitroreductase